MAGQENTRPFYFSPKGLSDALDSTKAFPGAMASLQNLVFDPSSPDVFQCRPAAVELLPPRFPNPIQSFGFVSVFKLVGDVLYGMVSSRLTPGHDQPFAFNLLTNTVIPVSGVLSTNVPASPATSGAWTPPTMDLIGAELVVTHPGFAQGAFATATDTLTFSGNPSNGDSITLGAVQTNQIYGALGTKVTFIYGTPVAADAQVQLVPNYDTITFAANPSNGDTITLNGTVVTFVTSGATGNQVNIGATLAATLIALQVFLAASTDSQISQCLYAISATVLAIKFNGAGNGSTFTVAASVATVASPTLAGGLLGTLINLMLFLEDSGDANTGQCTYALTFGGVTFTSNPAVNQTATINGVTYTFVASGATGNQVNIGANLAATLQALWTVINTVSPATPFTIMAATVPISYVASGASGNLFPVSATSAVIVATTPYLAGGVGNYFGWFNIVNPLAPVWNAGNTAINPLVTPPTAVAQFNSRAYFLLNPPNGQPGLLATDVLNPLQVTNGTYILTFGDNQPLTALAALPLTNQLGGIIQSVIVFKGSGNLVQVTGDPLPNTSAGAWTKNSLNVATGTLAPRSVTSTPQGLMFLSPQGYRLIDFNANVSPAIGANGAGVSVPFIQCPVPSRVVAASNASIMRVSLTNANGQQQEYWLDIAKGVWTGPHTFPAGMIAPYKNTFVVAPLELPNSIWQSDWLQNAGSTFVEPAGAMTWSYQTAMLPDSEAMEQLETHETLIKLSTGQGATATACDEGGNVISSCSIPAMGAQSNWGAEQWQGSMAYGQRFMLSPVQVPWPGPVVFGRVSLQFTGTSDSFTRIGALQIREEALGYLPQPGV